MKGDFKSQSNTIVSVTNDMMTENKDNQTTAKLIQVIHSKLNIVKMASTNDSIPVGPKLLVTNSKPNTVGITSKLHSIPEESTLKIHPNDYPGSIYTLSKPVGETHKCSYVSKGEMIKKKTKKEKKTKKTDKLKKRDKKEHKKTKKNTQNN